MKATSQQVIKVLKANGGFITQGAKSLGMTYQGLYQRISKDPELKEAYDAISESFLDFGESKLLVAMNQGQAWAICFYLKCKGKSRGWVERQEITGPEGGPVTFKVVDETEGKKLGIQK